MAIKYDAEATKRIICGDNVNVTDARPIKDLFQMFIKIILIIAFIYVFVYFLSGIILMNLSPERQAKVEKYISYLIQAPEDVATPEQKNRLYQTRNTILRLDKKFPKTSRLDMHIIKSDVYNAFCYPDGNIYITSALYDELKSDDELTFIVAHEMGHYRHKDHLLGLRRKISNGVVLITLFFASQNKNDLSKIAGKGLDITNLKFSRRDEAHADKYGAQVLNAIYGNTDAGVRALRILKKNSSSGIEFLSTHPNIDKRIEKVKGYSKH